MSAATVRAKTVRKTTPAATNADAPATPFPTATAVVIAKKPKPVIRAIRLTIHTPANASSARAAIATVLREQSRHRTDAKRTHAPRMTTAPKATVVKTAKRKMPNASRAAKTNNAAAPKDNCPTERANAFPWLAKQDWSAVKTSPNNAVMRECSASIPTRLNRTARRAKSIRNAPAPTGIWSTKKASA